MGIPRHHLPQIPSDKLDEFIKFCEERGVVTSEGAAHPTHLHPIQGEVKREKVEKMKADDNGEWQSILVAYGTKKPPSTNSHYFILDGHHRYIAQAELNPDKNISYILFHCPMLELIELGHEFDGSFTKTVNEGPSYRQLVQAIWL